MSTHIRKIFVVFSVFLVLAVSPLAAQVSTSAIAGTIGDGTGAVVPGADVGLKFLATGQERQSQTSASGEYVFSQLPPGEYEITVTTTGFQTAIVQSIVLAIAQRQVVNVTLHLNYAQVRRRHRRWSCGGSGSRVNSVT